MVCIGLKAQLLARGGMDIRGGNHPSRRRAFSPVLTRVADTLTQPGTAQRVDGFIPAAVFHMMVAVFNAPVVAEQLEQLLRAALLGTQAGQQIPALSVYFPSGYSHCPPSLSLPLPRPRKSQLLPDIVGQYVISPNPPSFNYTRSFSRVSACGSSSSSPANPSIKAASAVGWFPLTRTR